MKIFKLVLCLSFAASTAYASCDTAYITDIAANRATVVVDTGIIWQVFPHDRDKLATWCAGDEVMLCYGHMVNKRQDDEQVSIRFSGYFHHHHQKGCCKA